MKPNEEKIAQLEGTLDRILQWARAAESKQSLILPLSLAILGALAALATKQSTWEVFPAIVSSISTILLLLALLFSALAAFPRTSGPKGSLLFFGGICDLEQFKKAIHDQTDEEYIGDLLSQCHRNAQIAEKKFYWIQRSIASLFLSAPLWIVAVYSLHS